MPTKGKVAKVVDFVIRCVEAHGRFEGRGKDRHIYFPVIVKRNSDKTIPMVQRITEQAHEMIEDMDKRLARVERELRIQDRMLTELRRDLALPRPMEDIGRKYDPTKPLPDVMPITKGDER